LSLGIGGQAVIIAAGAPTEEPTPASTAGRSPPTAPVPDRVTSARPGWPDQPQRMRTCHALGLARTAHL